jgi:hypothetical protein
MNILMMIARWSEFSFRCLFFLCKWMFWSWCQWYSFLNDDELVRYNGWRQWIYQQCTNFCLYIWAIILEIWKQRGGGSFGYLIMYYVKSKHWMLLYKYKRWFIINYFIAIYTRCNVNIEIKISYEKLRLRDSYYKLNDYWKGNTNFFDLVTKVVIFEKWLFLLSSYSQWKNMTCN